MANKLYTDFSTGDFRPSDIILRADPSTGTLKKNTLSQLPALPNWLQGLRALNSALLSWPLGFIPSFATSGLFMSSGELYLSACYLSEWSQVTSLAFVQVAQGSYTANNNNQLGLYHFNGASLDLIDNTANNGNVFKQTSNTFWTEALLSGGNLPPGLYYTASLFHASATTTNPQIMSHNLNTYSTSQYFDVTSGIYPAMKMTGQTSLPATIAAGAAAKTTSMAIINLYGNPL